MREDIYSHITDDGQKKLDRLLELFIAYDSTNDPIEKERLAEEIRILKKEIVSVMSPFKSVECIVAGDKDAEQAEYVVCAEANPHNFRVDGTVEVPCSMCGIMVFLSPDSPKGPPKICFDCAVKEAEKNNIERDQDSLGA